MSAQIAEAMKSQPPANGRGKGKDKPCRDGAACTRQGCRFVHPDEHTAGPSAAEQEMKELGKQLRDLCGAKGQRRCAETAAACLAEWTAAGKDVPAILALGNSNGKTPLHFAAQFGVGHDGDGYRHHRPEGGGHLPPKVGGGQDAAASEDEEPQPEPELEAAEDPETTAAEAEAEYDDVAVCKLLLEYGADPNANTRRGHTPLIFAAGRYRDEGETRCLFLKKNEGHAADLHCAGRISDVSVLPCSGKAAAGAQRRRQGPGCDRRDGALDGRGVPAQEGRLPSQA